MTIVHAISEHNYYKFDFVQADISHINKETIDDFINSFIKMVLYNDDPKYGSEIVAPLALNSLVPISCDNVLLLCYPDRFVSVIPTKLALDECSCAKFYRQLVLGRN